MESYKAGEPCDGRGQWMARNRWRQCRGWKSAGKMDTLQVQISSATFGWCLGVYQFPVILELRASLLTCWLLANRMPGGDDRASRVESWSWFQESVD